MHVSVEARGRARGKPVRAACRRDPFELDAVRIDSGDDLDGCRAGPVRGVEADFEVAVDRLPAPCVADLAAPIDDRHGNAAGFGLCEYLERRGPCVDLGGVVYDDRPEMGRLAE